MIYLFIGWVISYIYYKLYWWLAGLGWLVMTMGVLAMIYTISATG